ASIASKSSSRTPYGGAIFIKLSSASANRHLHSLRCGSVKSSGLHLVPQQSIKAPGASSREDEIKEHEAELDGAIAFVQNRKKAVRRMHHEISHRHFTAKNESDRSCEKADQKQEAAESFENSAD